MIAIFPEIIALARSGDVERLAIAARRYFEGDRAAAKPNLIQVLKAAGLSVDTLAAPKLASGALGALAARDHRGAFRIGIVLSPALDELTSRFLLAHLFGHYLLDVLPLIASGDYAAGGFRELACPLRRYALTAPAAAAADPEGRKERRADAFAAALLLPRGMVKKALERIGDTGKAAAFFGVTRACLERRLMDLGLGQTAPGNFLDAETQLGGHAAKAAADDDALSAAVSASAPGKGDGVMPRSYAASTYDKTAKVTAARPGAIIKSTPAASAPGPAPSSSAAAPARSAVRPAPDRASMPKPSGAPQPTPTVSGSRTPAARQAPSAPGPLVAAEGGEGKKESALERLRAIARTMDKTMPKTPV